LRLERIVVVAEKPSVGRDIARVLGCTQRGEGCLIGPTHTVTWAVGHLVSLQDPDELDEKYKKWRMADLPILPEEIPLKVLSKTRSQFSIVKKLICDKETASLICATDAGREGELIFRFIYDKAKCRKPVQRLWISSMTDEAIKEGLDTLRPGSDYDGLYRSAVCRAEADWLVGMNASRAFTLRYNTLLSIGRVQTPTLALLVKRQQEIDTFKPETYFTLTADFGDYKGLWFDPKAESNDTHLTDPERAQLIAASVKGHTGIIELAETTPKQEPPPQLYDLTTLQRDANRLLGFTAQKTLKLAQSLYETHKALTYPRTDSRYLPKDMVGRTVQAIKNLPVAYQSMTSPALPDGKLPFSRRVFDDTKVSDHHAIIPTTKRANTDKMSPDELKLFDLVARRFLAAFYPPFLYDSVKILTRVDEHLFRTTGRTVTQMGWKEIVLEKANKKRKPEDEETALPSLAVADERLVKNTSVKKESTKPPSPHTDGSLLYAMEHAGREIEDEALREQMKGCGLGTPATRAAIIERLCKVGYAERKGKTIQPTSKGIQLISIVPNEIASPETTGRWEQALDQITTGRQDAERFLDGIRKLSAFLVNFAQQNKLETAFPQEDRSKSTSKSKPKGLTDAKCPVCGKGSVLKNSRAYYCSNWKAGCEFTLWFDCLQKGGGPLLSDKLTQLVLKNHQVEGSTGFIHLNSEQISFTPKGGNGPSAVAPLKVNRK